MKRVAALTGLLLALAVLSACASDGRTEGLTLEELSQTLSVDLSQATVTEEEDTHGGFQGDGERWVVVSLEEDVSSALEEAGWQELPLPQPLEAAVYGVTEEAGGQSISEGPYFQREIPRISDGYYFFRDRHSQAADPTDPSELLERASFNFTVALYDRDSQTLYYGELDT